jgi:hypothetical protein
MKLKSATFQALKPRHFIVAGALLLTGACQANDQASGQVSNETAHTKEPSTMKVNQTKECPIVSSSDWSAHIATSEQGERMLSIKGDIELPSPAYSVILEQGMADKSATPSQHFNLKIEQVDGMFIQMITPMTLEHSAPSIAKQYRSIVIHCGDQVIASIENVTAQ